MVILSSTHRANSPGIHYNKYKCLHIENQAVFLDFKQLLWTSAVIRYITYSNANKITRVAYLEDVI